MQLLLCGYMGSGKTAVGKEISKRLKLKFVDLDQRITTIERIDIPGIFRSSGEIYFRKLEHKTLKELLLPKDDQVVSLGGGTPCYGNNMELIKSSGAVLAFLKTELKTLTERLFKQKETRPLISHFQEKKALEDFIRKHLFERNPYYFQSDISIETTGKSIETIANEIVEALN